MSDLAKERDRLHVLLQKQKKQQTKHERHRKGTQARHDAKIRLHRLKGLIATTQAAIENLVSKQNQGPKAAVRWALSQQGVTEHPAGSNWGPPVEDWIRSTGYTQPEPWCGCFAKVAVVDHGHARIPAPIHLGYTGNIVSDAQAKRNGLREVPFGGARPGDIVVFTFGHIGVVRGHPSATMLPTVEGNTSPVSSGSQFNGGCVAAKSRSRSDVELIARPAYPSS